MSHLDLKPTNVLLRESPGDTWPVPKVADWGLATDLLHSTDDTEGFTPAYAAPEQFDEAYGQPEKATDIYQLGVVIYELVAGQRPFREDESRISNQVLDGGPESRRQSSRHYRRLSTIS